MSGTMMNLMSGWVMAFTDVMEIVAIVLPVCGLCTAAVILFAPKVGMFRVTLLPRRTESATADASPASSGDCRLPDGLNRALRDGFLRRTASM